MTDQAVGLPAAAAPGKASRRAAILARAGVLAEEQATMPGDDGAPVPVLVRELTGKQSREFEMAVARNVPAPLGLLLSMCVCDVDTKEPLFEATDREALEALGTASLRPIAEIAARLSGLDDADMAKALARLGNAPSNGSTSS